MHPLQEFLNTHFKESVSDFEELGEGHFSQAFGFTHQGSTKVLRVADSDQDFLKDKLISEKTDP